MYLFDLKELSTGQEVPKILLRPFKIFNNSIYLEKIVIAKDHEWTDGIYEYNITDKSLTRIDSGPHVNDPTMFDVEIPFTFEDIKILQTNDSIYYSATTEFDYEVYIKFYEINLKTMTQKLILSFTYERDEILYRGMEILSDGYLIFRISDAQDDSSGFGDRIFLIDVEERAYYEIFDEIMQLTYGSRFIIGDINKQIVLEEYYLSEQEQLDLLTLKDVELAFDLPDDVDENYIHKNALYSIPLKEFISCVKASVTPQYKLIDEIFMDGSIRTIGETDKYIYYKKKIYDHVLKQSSDFVARQMIGKEIVMKLNKSTLKTSIVGPYPYHSKYIITPNKLYVKKYAENLIQLENIETKTIDIEYEKSPDIYTSEDVIALVDSRTGIVKKQAKSSKSNSLELLSFSSNKVLASATDIFIIGTYVFFN